MKLEQVRQRLVEEELKSYREWRRRDLLPSLLSIALGGMMVWGVVAQPPAVWARGEWFRPGGWLHDLVGYAGAVLLVRALMMLALLAAIYWFGATLRALSTGGARRRRARIAAEQPRFRQPWEER
jgi:hypothetical protein